MSDETTVWEGSSSQVVNLPVFLLCGLLIGVFIGAAGLVATTKGPPMVSIVLAALSIAPLLYALLRAWQTKCRLYRVTTERLRISSGILTRRTDEVELYRVKDYVLFEPFFLRVFGLADLVLKTDDAVNPNVLLRAIPGGQALKDQIRRHVEVCRDKKRVRVTEFDQGPTG